MASQPSVMMRPLAVMMSRDFQAISADATLVDAAELMRTARVGALLVSASHVHVGVVSERDLVRKAMARGADPTQERVGAVMSSPIISLELDRSAHEASDLMAEKGIRHLVITHEGAIVGMISVRDLLRYFKNWGTL